MHPLRGTTRLIWIFAAMAGHAAEIRGIVLDNNSGEPIPEANIQLLSGGGVIAEAQSAENGRFEFDGSFNGILQLSATQTGYVDLFANQRTAVAVSDRKNPSPVELRLTRACVIAGQVSDASGQPLRDVKVAAMMRRARGGKVDLVEVRSVFTNDLGSYRLFGLAPAIYTVAVFPNGEDAGEPALLPVHFPNVTDRLRAEFFKIAAGETRTGMDFNIAPLAALQLAGTVTGAPAGWSAAVRLYADGGDPIATVYCKDGKFTFPAVPAGAYRLVAWAPIFGSGEHGPIAASRGKMAVLPVGTVSSDIADLHLQLEDLGTVSGRASGDQGGTCSGARAVLRPVDPLPGAQELNATLNRGTFTIHDVPPGRYRLQLLGLRGGCYLKQVRSADANPESGTVLVSGNTQVDLILAADPATVSGNVMLPDGKSPAPAAQVLLIAAETGDPEDDVRFAPAMSDGRFRFELVRPGDYQVLALPGINSLDYLDPVFAAEHGAARITARPGTESTVEVTLR